MSDHVHERNNDTRGHEDHDSPYDRVRWHYETNRCLTGRHHWCYGREWTPELELVMCTCYCHTTYHGNRSV